VIASKDNPKVKRWTRLVQDARARRDEGRLIVEGPHLVAEALQAGIEPLALLVSESGLKREEIQVLLRTREPVMLKDGVFRAISDTGTPQGIAAEIAVPRLEKAGDWIFLEGVQDPSNVGAILRSAAAFGAGQVVLDRACADPWSPRALRAGMGGHFKVAIRQVSELAGTVEGFAGTTLCTVAAGGQSLPQVELKGSLGWIFGTEGRGISDELVRRAARRVTIPMKPGNESLNVAATAAICLYEAFRRRGTGKIP
jgi:TrmH family RNA methyltransferase